jgi:hypothetical protein
MIRRGQGHPLSGADIAINRKLFCRKLLKESFLTNITHSWQEFSARPGKNNPAAGKKSKCEF